MGFGFGIHRLWIRAEVVLSLKHRIIDSQSSLFSEIRKHEVCVAEEKEAFYPAG